MTETEMKARALEMVKEYHPTHDNIRVAAVVDNFFDGTVLLVDFSENGKDRRDIIHFGRDRPILFQGSQDFIRAFAGKTPRVTAFESFLRYGAGDVAAVIAVIITLTICYIVLTRVEPKIPEVLSGALTTIIGFFFGSKVGRTAAGPH